MKKIFLILSITFSVLILFNSCKKHDDDNNNTNPTGNLKVDFTWYSSKGGDKGDTNTCDLIDIKGTILEIAVSTDAIVDGQPDNLIWTTIYTSSSSMYFTERQVPVISLPTGNYKSIKIVQKNAISWRCIFNSDTLEFEDFNNSSMGPDDTVPTNYFYSDGLHELDTIENFFLHQTSEKLGSFEIIDGQTTNLSWRMNITNLDWIDVNANGIWDTGTDKLDNWQLPPGVTTMFDFIVTY